MERRFVLAGEPGCEVKTWRKSLLTGGFQNLIIALVTG
jgi:hypothetical protein